MKIEFTRYLKISYSDIKECRGKERYKFLYLIDYVYIFFFHKIKNKGKVYWNHPIKMK